jgi:hypothetical protein
MDPRLKTPVESKGIDNARMWVSALRAGHKRNMEIDLLVMLSEPRSEYLPGEDAAYVKETDKIVAEATAFLTQ